MVPGCGGTEPQTGLNIDAARNKLLIAHDRFIKFHILYPLDDKSVGAVANRRMVEERGHGW